MILRGNKMNKEKQETNAEEKQVLNVKNGRSNVEEKS
jgi:hypothetical protein